MIEFFASCLRRISIDNGKTAIWKPEFVWLHAVGCPTYALEVWAPWHGTYRLAGLLRLLRQWCQW
jgi:hypothetical protein